MNRSKDHGQDAHATLRTRQGAYLPHWTRESATYFVTFRLGDSLPKHVLQAWLFERDNIVKTARQMGRPLSEDEEKRLQELHLGKMESYLDAGHGACWMKGDRIAAIIANALKHFDGGRYDLIAWSVMPNHVHVLVRPCEGHDLPDILHSWKSFTAKEANKALGRKGDFWQDEYYDHLVRDEADFTHCASHVLNNPKKAGLKGWKWVSESGASGTGVPLVKDHGQDAHGTGSRGVPPVRDHGQPRQARGGADAHATS